MTRWEPNTRERFFSLIRRDRNGCEYLIALNHHRSRSHNRYFAFEGKVWIAARLAFTFRHGPIPDGFGVCHTCDNRWCLRDDHHFLGTQQDNMDDMVKKNRQPRLWGNTHVLGKRWTRSKKSVSQMWKTRYEKYGSSGRRAP